MSDPETKVIARMAEKLSVSDRTLTQSVFDGLLRRKRGK
jgi:hypothetical protein